MENLENQNENGEHDIHCSVKIHPSFDDTTIILDNQEIKMLEADHEKIVNIYIETYTERLKGNDNFIKKYSDEIDADLIKAYKVFENEINERFINEYDKCFQNITEGNFDDAGSNRCNSSIIRFNDIHITTIPGLNRHDKPVSDCYYVFYKVFRATKILDYKFRNQTRHFVYKLFKNRTKTLKEN